MSGQVERDRCTRDEKCGGKGALSLEIRLARSRPCRWDKWAATKNWTWTTLVIQGQTSDEPAWVCGQFRHLQQKMGRRLMERGVLGRPFPNKSNYFQKTCVLVACRVLVATR